MASWFRSMILRFFLSVAGAVAFPAFAEEMEPHLDTDRGVLQDQLQYHDPIHDVGVVSIDSPPESVHAGSAYPVMVSVANFGDFIESFDVWYLFVVNGLPYQREDNQVYGLMPGDTVQVTFPTPVFFHSASAAFFLVTWVLLEGDSILTNDTLGRNFYVYPPGIDESVEGVLFSNDHYLDQSRPNPFSRETVIRYELASPALVSLRIYDRAGQFVRTLVDGAQEAGFKSAVWDGSDRKRESVPSGIYFYRFLAGDFTATRKLVILR